MTAQRRVGMPMIDFIRQYAVAPFELIDGRKCPKRPPDSQIDPVVRLLYTLLLTYQQVHRTIHLYRGLPYVSLSKAGRVTCAVVPDLMVYGRERLAAYASQTEDWQRRPFALAPDLYVKVVSRRDRYSDVEAQVACALNDGGQVAWVFNPPRGTVRIHTAGSRQIIELRADDRLDGGELLPRFTVRVGSLFAMPAKTMQ